MMGQQVHGDTMEVCQSEECSNNGILNNADAATAMLAKKIGKHHDDIQSTKEDATFEGEDTYEETEDDVGGGDVEGEEVEDEEVEGEEVKKENVEDEAGQDQEAEDAGVVSEEA